MIDLKSLNKENGRENLLRASLPDVYRVFILFCVSSKALLHVYIHGFGFVAVEIHAVSHVN